MSEEQQKIADVLDKLPGAMTEKEMLQETIAKAAIEKIELQTEVRVLREILGHAMIELGKRK